MDEQKISAHLTSSQQTAESPEKLSLKRKMEEDWRLDDQIRPGLKRLRREEQIRKIRDKAEKRLEEIGEDMRSAGERYEKRERDEIRVALGTGDSGEPGGNMLSCWTTSHL